MRTAAKRRAPLRRPARQAQVELVAQVGGDARPGIGGSVEDGERLRRRRLLARQRSARSEREGKGGHGQGGAARCAVHQTPFRHFGSSRRSSRTSSDAVGVDGLRAGPAHGPAHAARLDLRAQAHRPAVEPGRQAEARPAAAARRADARRRGPPPTASRRPRVSASDAQHAGHAGHAVVGERHHQLRRSPSRLRCQTQDGRTR